MATEVARRSRRPARLALGQVRYQLRLLLRSPLGFFLSIVFPLLLLVCLKVIAPSRPVDGLPYAQWVTPAMCAFCLLNACYVAVITSMVLAREEGMLKRLRGTPLPGWAYLAGRSGSAFVTSVIACGVIIAIGAAFFGVRIVWHAFGYFAGAALLGVACFFLIGAAVTTVVPKTETALPIAFGTMLPLAFISGVFFHVSHPPAWLHDLAWAFPVAPVARAMEDSFNPATRSWPMSVPGLLVVLGWSAAAIVVIALAFPWEPGPAPAARGLGWLTRSQPGHSLSPGVIRRQPRLEEARELPAPGPLPQPGDESG
jgi:ABC-2 type transport system permease protein